MCVSVSVRARACVCVRVCVCACMCLYVRACVYVCMRTRTHAVPFVVVLVVTLVTPVSADVTPAVEVSPPVDAQSLRHGVGSSAPEVTHVTMHWPHGAFFSINAVKAADGSAADATATTSAIVHLPADKRASVCRPGNVQRSRRPGIFRCFAIDRPNRERAHAPGNRMDSQVLAGDRRAREQSWHDVTKPHCLEVTPRRQGFADLAVSAMASRPPAAQSHVEGLPRPMLCLWTRRPRRPIHIHSTPQPGAARVFVAALTTNF
jgi:hypothetical protein